MSIASSLEKRKLEILKFEVNNMENYKKTSHCIQCVFVNKPCIISDTGGEKIERAHLILFGKKPPTEEPPYFHLKILLTSIV